ncbi:hypothetical protein CTI12_AA596050 [Artemisia annua]|uniref:Uncharacterized protein n=1 Tax=Artemisia annua TaxID=35608 RepID=A0A2U1KJ88_ARTAN|nr:hypothetical protein CTI12_AA596050 [Artemisia annua]
MKLEYPPVLTRIPSTPNTAMSYPPDEQAKEENKKQCEEKLKSHALTMKEEMVKKVDAEIEEMFPQYTHQPPINSLTCNSEVDRMLWIAG